MSLSTQSVVIKKPDGVQRRTLWYEWRARSGRRYEQRGVLCLYQRILKAISVISGRVALAIDLRPSSPEIAAACAAAIRYAGLKVDYCGAIPTPALAA